MLYVGVHGSVCKLAKLSQTHVERTSFEIFVETQYHISRVHLPQDSVCSLGSGMWHRYVNTLWRSVLSTVIIVLPCASLTVVITPLP